MKKIASIAMVMLLAVSVAACERKDKPKVVKTEKIEYKAPMSVPTLQSLDGRVTVLENRLDAAKAARARAAKRVVAQ